MSGKLTMRAVRDDNARRVSVYLRPDGKYVYVEEVISEWDDCPPSWLEGRPSGIFESDQAAMADARLTIEWMRTPSDQDDCFTDVDAPLRNWRPIGVSEYALIMHLLREKFEGRAAILEQMKSLEVMRVGRWSLMLWSEGPLAEVKESDTPSQRPNDRIPVEAFYDDVIDETTGLIRVAALVRIALHVTNGKLSELEIYKENGKPILIDPYEIDLSRVHLY